MAAVAVKPRIVVEQAAIAHGGHSAIYMGRYSNSLEAVAVKEIDLDKEDIALYENEIVALRALPEHKNLPKLIGCSRRKNKAQIVMSYFPFPTLKLFLEERGALSSEDALYIFHQLVDAINSMKKAGVAHRDLKSENILINPNSLQIKIVDFGLATVRTFLTEADVDDSFVGTPYYMAPDVLRRNKVYQIISSDLWSAGVILLECLLGEHPFAHLRTTDDLLAYYEAGIPLFENFDANSKVVLTDILAHSESMRSSLNDVLKFLRTVAPLTSTSPRRSRWIAPLSKSLY